MANNLHLISSYTIKSSDIFFFDNNIWMYILCPMGNYNRKKQGIYSKFLSDLISRKSHIYVNSLVLSEFSNRYLKLDFDLLKMQPGNAGMFNNYKRDYVPSQYFQSTIIDIKTHILHICSLCQRSSDEFNSIDIKDVMSSFVQIGFNDSYYITLATKKGWIIVSDDSDFTNNKVPDLNLTILTA